MKKSLAAFAFFASLESLAGTARADEVLGSGTGMLICGSLANFDQVELSLRVGSNIFFQAVIGTSDVGTLFVIDSGTALEGAVALLTNGLPDLVWQRGEGFPAGGACASATTEAGFFTLAPCLGDIDFQGATIDRLEVFIESFEIQPDTFTNFTLTFELTVHGECPPSAITIDFSSDDGGTPLVNGQDIQSSSEFGVHVAIDGLSSTGLYPAIFDSTPGGPNDPSQDTDLLVGLGNVLILQERPAQSIPGIYDRPNDDSGGGSIVFDFMGYTATPQSLTLIDIDSAPDSASVRLVDSGGRSRTYSVPAGWTEDLLQNGPPGYRALDLTTLAPQPGFLAVATATEEPGFELSDVVRLDVDLGGSGALDDLVFLPNTPAVTIDFEDLDIPPGSLISPPDFEPIESNGFLFEPTVESDIPDVHAGNDVSFWSSNGTTIVSGHGYIRMTRVGGGTFSLRRFDFAGWPTDLEAPSFVMGSNGVVDGHVPDGLVDGPGGAPDFETFLASPLLHDVTSVLFVNDLPSGPMHTFVLDNLIVRTNTPLVGSPSAPRPRPIRQRPRHPDPCLP